MKKAHKTASDTDQNTKSLIMGGGCFWCIEAHMKLADGVLDAKSGYSGGELENPTYETYADGGHREVVRVLYDPEKTSYQKLLEYFLKDIDPTDGDGSFGDRGEAYAPAIYYQTEEEKETAEKVLQTLEKSGIFDAPLKVLILPEKPFFEAEGYHQNYAEENPTRYGMYHKLSGREKFVKDHQGAETAVFEKEDVK